MALPPNGLLSLGFLLLEAHMEEEPKKSSLATSRKFWLMIGDVFFSAAIYFTTKYAAPEIANDILFLLGLLQPVVIALIASITVQNVQHIKNKAFAEVEVSVLKSATIEQELPQ